MTSTSPNEIIEGLKGELEESEARLRALMEMLPFQCWIMGADGRYVAVNAAARVLAGDVVGKRPEDLSVPPALLAAWQANNARAFAGEKVHTEVEEERGDLRTTMLVSVTPIACNGVVTGIVGTNVDATDRARLRAEMDRAQRFESVSVMAGNIAHDFNNVLMTLMGSLALARRIVDQPKAVELLATATRACDQARGLTHQLLTFARGTEPVRLTFAVDTLVEETIPLALRNASVHHELSVAADLPLVRGDRGQIQHALDTVVLNAVQAMQAGGHLRVTARALPAAERPAVPALVADRPYVEVRVEDDGTGFPSAVLSRLFTSHVTTKPPALGVGLVIAHAILERHGGAIAASNRPEGGASVSIYLPTLPVLPTSMSSAEDESGGDASDAGHPRGGRVGEGRVLVLDDDAPLRHVIAQLLEQLGYVAEVASTADECVERFARAQRDGRPFDVVILDLTPGGQTGSNGRDGAESAHGGGIACLGRLRAIAPKVRAILSSGYGNAQAISDPASHGFAGVLPKPFLVGDLAHVLDAVRAQK